MAGESVHKFSRALRDDVIKFEEALGRNADGEPEAIPPEGKRILKRLALVCAAGILANEAGVLPWKTSDILDSIMDVRDRWLHELGADRSEEDKGLQHLRGQLFQNLARFKTPGDTSHVLNLLGVRLDGGDLLIFPQAYPALCGEFDSNDILQSLKSRGWLKHDKGRLNRKTPVPLTWLSNTARPRMFHIKAEFLDETAAAVQTDFIEPDGDGVPL